LNGFQIKANLILPVDWHGWKVRDRVADWTLPREIQVELFMLIAIVSGVQNGQFVALFLAKADTFVELEIVIIFLLLFFNNFRKVTPLQHNSIFTILHFLPAII